MKHTIQKGFTLVEMLTVLAIFSILTGITLFNYGKFRSDTILTNMAYEVALSIREAQIYGVSARNSAVIGTADSKPYGIYFNTSGDNGKKYLLFTDDNNGKTFNGSETSCTTANGGGDTCITSYSLQQNIKITNLQIKGVSGNCVNPNPSGTLSILFKRPNIEPLINGSSNETLAIITLSAAGGGTRYVVVYNNGQIAVLNDIAGIC